MEKKNKIGFCDWCGKRTELIQEGKALICFLCKSNIGVKRGKEIKREHIETKTMPMKRYEEFLRESKKGIVLGHIVN